MKNNWQKTWTSPMTFRFLLVAIAVLLCLQMEWRFLRFLTSEMVLQLSSWLGVATHRLSFDLIQVGGTRFSFTVSCTFADVWCGSLPLLWKPSEPWRTNLRTLVIYTICLFGFNIVRLEIGYLLYQAGIPWLWSHEVLSGPCYFAVWLWLVRYNEWLAPAGTSLSLRNAAAEHAAGSL